ncbi:hypothetical protein CYMTET_44271 [Cymbomonas tetramitiformis]|uniref:Uncharacterized protein n=1 Tax=Cymbomonas tetramitiformis TaxID=36881 RepID=A0AAE0C1S4_9CHLO|nr:hypothetical protein CYMTET_44271 [Cymbomonas tetramitiformis]
MLEHHEAACRVVASIKGGPEAFVQQCRRLKQSNDEQVLESICDTVCERVTKKCYVASLASDREKAFDTVDMTTLNELNTECTEFVDSYKQCRSAYFEKQESPVDNLTSKFATASISPVAGVQKRVPRSRDASRQVTPQPSKAPSVTDGDVPAEAARIVSLQRVSELETELAMKETRIADLESKLKAQVDEMDLAIADSRSADTERAQLRARLDEYEVQVAKQQLQIIELKAAQLNPAAAVNASNASTSRKGSKKQLETELDAANQSVARLQTLNEVLIRNATAEVCDIEDLESILDGPLNSAGYDWSITETESETLAKVFIFALDADAEADADADADDATVANEGAKKAKEQNLLHGLPMTLGKGLIQKNRLNKAAARELAEVIAKDGTLYLKEADGLLEK